MSFKFVFLMNCKESEWYDTLNTENRATNWGFCLHLFHKLCKNSLIKFWFFGSSGLFSFHLDSGIDDIYKIMQLVFFLKLSMNSLLWYTIITGDFGVELQNLGTSTPMLYLYMCFCELYFRLAALNMAILCHFK